MKILLDNAQIIGVGAGCLAVENESIIYVGNSRPEGPFDRVIDCRGGLLLPGLYNCHTHAAMTLFRGYGEDLPLQSWLNDRIFPAEDLLTDEAVYVASQWAIAEMLRNGIVSFTDMYMFSHQTVKAALETGIKANISRCVVSFDPDADYALDSRIAESKALFNEFHGAGGGRIKIDMSLHAEYTNVPKASAYLFDCAAAMGAQMQIHISETEREHKECLERHGVTPLRFFYENGGLSVPVTAAHCVWVDDADMALMKECGVSVAHNPVSNLKLGSGVMRLPEMLKQGINVTLGSDGAASNNTLDIFKEMYLAAILHKGVCRDTTNTPAGDMLKMATENGAMAQGRAHCGRLAEGCRADVILVDLNAVNNVPYYDLTYAAVYSANSSNVRMTMVDGRILYENGEYLSFDFEQLQHDMRDVCARYFQK